jgi:mono/diheme cytochrome c family protein
VGFTFLERDTLGKDTRERAYLAEYGPPAATGMNHAKRIVELLLHPKTGGIMTMPLPIVQYTGPHRTTVLGLAEGSDGLYFTDFFGAIEGGDAKGQGAVYRVYPSEKTLTLATTKERAGTPEERGEELFFGVCTACHRYGDVGGHEGPELTGLRARLDERLHSEAYEAELESLLSDEKSFAQSQAGRLRAVLGLTGGARVAQWFEFHLIEPRFDNLRAKMPSFAETLSPESRGDLAAFLLRADAPPP